MLILPPGHAQAVRQPRVIRPRERAMIGGLLAVLAALAVALGVSFATAGQESGHGCIVVGLAYSTGGAEIHRCGASARALCAGVDRPGGSTGATARALTTQCRKAGLPVG